MSFVTGFQKTAVFEHYLAVNYGLAIKPDGSWVPAHFTQTQVQGFIDGFTLAQAKDMWKVRVREYAGQIRQKIMEGYTAWEMASWSEKLREARAYLDEATAETRCPSLFQEAQRRSMPVSVIVDRVILKSGIFMGKEANIAGFCGNLCDAIDAAQSFQEIEQMSLFSGWPE